LTDAQSRRFEDSMFETGKEYNRRNDIHEQFGGQQQGGISTPSGHPFIFLFTGSSGDQFGYEDGWQPDNGIFLYTGEGQVGDMSFKAGNRAIRDHVQDDKTLLLFEALGKRQPVKFIGAFECAAYDLQNGPDRYSNLRKTIRFHLLPVEKDGEEDSDIVLPQAKVVSLSVLRQQALNAVLPEDADDWKEAKVRRRQRSDTIRRYVLARANGICELTGDPAPFLTKLGQPYLEVHHINRRSDGGLDDPRNCAAITPTAHREIHHGLNGERLNSELINIVHMKERAV
jgi:5-methylcytosine-specific restriction protein A